MVVGSEALSLQGGAAGANNTLSGYDASGGTYPTDFVDGNLIGQLEYSGNTLYSRNPTSIFSFSRPTWIDGTANSAASGNGWTMVGGSGADTVVGNSNADSIVAGNGADSIVGGGGADSINAGAGADTIVFADRSALNAAATVIGGAGNDTISITAAGTVVDDDFADINTVEVLSLNGASTFTGGVEAGSSGLQSVFGGTTTHFKIASDYGTGTVELIGSTGVDTFEVNRATGTTNIRTVRTGADAGLDVLASSSDVDLLTGGTGVSVLSGVLDSVLLTGTDNINAIGNNNSNTITGNSGNNSFTANGGGDSIIGNGGDDTFVGGSGLDTFVASSGNDSLVGNGGADSILGGDGNDTIVGADASDVIDGGANTDTLKLSASYTPTGDANLEGVENIVVTGNVAAVTVDLSNQTGEAFTVTLSNQGDSVTTADGADNITGGDGADSINGGSGADNISAGAGNDTIVGAQDDTLLDGGADTTGDWLRVGANFDDFDDAQIANIEKVEVTATGLTVNLGVQTEGLTIFGFASGTTNITSGSGDDSLFGGTGADTLTGGNGNDTLKAWTGTSTFNTSNDTLIGGAGTDVFVLGDAAGNAYGFDSNPAVNYRALITGFAMGTDRFELSDLDQTGAVTVAADGLIANQINISVGGLHVYRFNFDNDADTGTLYVAGTTKVVAELTGFTGTGSQLTASSFNIV